MLGGSAGEEGRKDKRRVPFEQSCTLCLPHHLSSCLLTSLSASGGQLGGRLPLLTEILLLCAPVSPRTGTDTYLKAAPSQHITTTQVRRQKQEAVRTVSPLTPDHPPPLWSLGLRNIEKPQVRGSKARERKLGEAEGRGQQRESTCGDGNEWAGWVSVKGEVARGRGA